MNTPAHLLIGAAAFARPGTSRLMAAALIGAVLPDLSLYLLAGVSIHLLDIPPHIVFRELYFSDAWQMVFAIDNSFVIWGGMFGLSLWRRDAFWTALCGAALLHLALDFPLHHNDGRPHFWPLTNWVYESPLSYWDRAHGSRWIAPLEAVLSICAAGLLWRRGLALWAVILCAVLLIGEIWVVRQWLFVFMRS